MLQKKQKIDAEGQVEFRREGEALHFHEIVRDFNHRFQRMLELYVVAVNRTILRPVASTIGILGAVVLTFALFRSWGELTFHGQIPASLLSTSNVQVEHDSN